MPKLTKITSWQGSCSSRTQHYSQLDSFVKGGRDDSRSPDTEPECSEGDGFHRSYPDSAAGCAKRRTASPTRKSKPGFGLSHFRKPSSYDGSCPLTEQPNPGCYSSSSSSATAATAAPTGHSKSCPQSSSPSTRTVFRHIRYTLSRPLKKVKSHIKNSVDELHFQTRRTCRGLKKSLKGQTGLVTQIMQVLLVPWQAVRGILWVLLLICLEVAEILLSIVFAILYKTLRVIVTTLLVPVIIVIGIVNLFR